MRKGYPVGCMTDHVGASIDWDPVWDGMLVIDNYAVGTRMRSALGGAHIALA